MGRDNILAESNPLDSTFSEWYQTERQNDGHTGRIRLTLLLRGEVKMYQEYLEKQFLGLT